MTDSPLIQHLTDAMRCQQLGQFDEADRLCRIVLEREPANLEALQLYAGGKYLREQFGEAFETLSLALRHNPANVENTVLAAHCLRALGNMSEAADTYMRAVALAPHIGDFRVMAGSTLRAAGRTAEAMTVYHEALALDPSLTEAHNNMGVLYHDQGELEPAIASYRAALALQPQHLGARQNMASALRALGRFEEALAAFETILTYDPGHAYATLMVVHSKRELCQWEGHDVMTAHLHRIATTQPGKVSPLLLFACPLSPEQLLSAAQAYARNFAPPTPPTPFPATPKVPGQKIRVGYFSADFREHVVATVIAEVLERHDRAAFDVIGYSYGPDDQGPQRRRIQAACTAFHDIRTLSDEGAARKIRDDRIDVLVDLNGYTGNIRHQVPARCPAPVQISWLGYPGTTGSPAMDYIIADRFTIPVGTENFYSEKIIRLPGSNQPHDSTRHATAPKSRAAYGLPENGIVFCSFNYPQKITPEIFSAWMSILNAVPQSVLWLRADRAPTMANLRKEAVAAGVAADRLIFATRTPDLADHLARYSVADVALDTFPYNSHTTANDALWMNVPLVTLAGHTCAARIAGGILNALGLPDLVVNSVSGYRDIAVKLATDSARRADLRRRLTAARETGPHFDTARFTRNLETAYRKAWDIHAAGQPPRHIDVDG